MSARSKARKRALDVLYATELRGQDPVVALEAAVADGEGPTNPYTETLVRGVVGDSATGRTKPATLETGHEIQVPLFITQGEKVKVDTRDSSYLGRVKA